MVARGGHGDEGTSARILDVAERLVQVRGFNGFSYADIAAELQITKAALHYHFASKADLGEALITRYADRFSAALDAVDNDGTGAGAKLAAYARLYQRVLTQQEDVPVRHARRRVPDPAAAHARRGDQLLRPQRGVAGGRAGAGQGRGQPDVRRLGPGHRPHDRGRAGRGDARGPALRGRRARFQAAAASLLAGLSPSVGESALAGLDPATA